MLVNTFFMDAKRKFNSIHPLETMTVCKKNCLCFLQLLNDKNSGVVHKPTWHFSSNLLTV